MTTRPAKELPRQLSCIDLFAGAGGLSIGLQQAGFSVVAAIEIEDDACKSYAASHPESECVNAPIEEIKLSRFQGVEVVAGGPPCQPFSSGGKRMSHEDGRDMLPQYVRAIRALRPKAFLLENVPGLATGQRAEYLNMVLDELRGLGYVLSAEVLNAAEYGVPQKRKRLFVVGLHKALQTKFSFPTPTHGPGAEKPYAAAGSVLDPIRIVGEGNPSIVTYARRPDLRPSPFDGHLFNGGGRAIDLDAPCHTILASAGGNKTHFLDTENLVPSYHRHLMRGGKPRVGTLHGGRRLSVQESALIQTFPKGMKFFGSRSSQYKQIGNAVPPRLARVVGEALAKAIR